MCKKLFARLTKSKDPSSSRYRRDMARQICGHHVRYITEKRNDIEEVIGREGSLNIKDDCFIVSTPADTILRCRIEDMLYITADGKRNLTECPKELIEV